MLYLNDLRIRLIDENDADFLLNLRLSPTVNDLVGHFIFLNNSMQKNWIGKNAASNDSMYFILEKIDEANPIKIGMVRVNHIDRINGSMSVGGDIIEDFRGKGYGKKMFQLIFKLGFDYWNMNRLWLHVLKNNVNAFELYKKMGFVEEGVQRKAVYRDGKYIDYLMMSILHDEYRSLSK